MVKDSIQIQGVKIGAGCPVFMVAEIGTNYNGDASLAKECADAAFEAGANAVKFQIITAERSYVSSSESYKIFKSLEMPKEKWWEVFKHCSQKGYVFFPTFTNEEDFNAFKEVPWPLIKVSSSNLTNFPYLSFLAKQGIPIILSTGQSHLDEVSEAVELIKGQGEKRIILLQCTTIYPAPIATLHIRAMTCLKESFPDLLVGFSDHSQGFVGAVAATALGACLIEKHFTLNKGFKGPDHAFSADPKEFRELVSYVRQCESALGGYEKKLLDEERPFRDKWQRSLVALETLHSGDKLTQKNVGIKRALERGLPPKCLEEILGLRLKTKVEKDDLIRADDVEGFCA